MKERILLVESSPDLADNLKILISGLKDCQIVGHSDSGLDAMRRMSALTPDILILDLSLPDMTAMDVARWAQRLFPRISLVLLSTYDLPEYRAAATSFSGSAFISKADLWRKMPQALRHIRRKHLARERERGGLLVTRWHQQLRHLTAWVENTASARNQVGIWRLIHLAMAVLSLEFLMAFVLWGQVTLGLMTAGWSILLAALIHDFYTLRTGAGSRVTCTLGEGHYV